MGRFAYSDEIVARFPTIRGGVLHASSLANGPTPTLLRDAYRAEQLATTTRIGGTPLSEIPSIAAWRRVFSLSGVKPTQYRNAAEALLRRFTKRGDIPSINLLVDLANLRLQPSSNGRHPRTVMSNAAGRAEPPLLPKPPR